ncbi:DUF192 domain-containing protein [Nordella sp. HKS 07]|uniref:DUF192 domain-containing protein n=1 Tax=Nordella sp. HKS 07 TaxID=2712222 RepID=UPI0013E175BD|nr:DUF192 domain-containing protein [Nordella sp. HKS 07]QIG50981.1 DUF192 domain-containing protein [Nordella sp. HKS 07]
MRSVVVAFLLVITAAAAGLAQTPSGMPLIALTIQGKDGATKADLTVELAETPEHRAKGLMFRNELADNRGMLFDFKETRSVSMWMKNTPLSLDMIFTDDKGAILYIARNTVPFSEDIISPGMPVYAVLEVKAGTTGRLAIEPGDRLVTPIFNTGG